MKHVAWILMSLSVLACDKGGEEPGAEANDTPPTEATEAVALTDEAVDQAELAVKEDFEDEAFSAIDEDNLESQLDAIEKEIDGDTQ